MRKTQVLVVEDEAIVAEDIRATLAALGYDVPAVLSSGHEAIKKAGEFNPDIVLMDIILKGEMDGIEAAQHIQAQLDIPVVYLTAHGDDTTFQRAKISVPFGYLLKPFDSLLMRNTIEMAIYKHGIEKKLRESEARYRAIVEDQTELVIRFLTNGTLTFVNDTYCRYLGKKQEDLIGQNFLQFIFGEDVEKVKRQMMFLSPEMPVVMSENRMVKPTGMITWLQSTYRAIFDNYHHISEIQSVCRDITERKRTEEALLTIERQYRELREDFDKKVLEELARRNSERS